MVAKLNHSFFISVLFILEVLRNKKMKHYYCAM